MILWNKILKHAPHLAVAIANVEIIARLEDEWGREGPNRRMPKITIDEVLASRCANRSHMLLRAHEALVSMEVA